MNDSRAEETTPDLFADGSATSRRLASNMVIIVAGKAFTVVAGLLAMAILARHLGPERFGHYRTALTYMSLAAVLADLGLYMVTLKEITRPGADIRAILSAGLALRLVASTLIMSGAAFAAILIPYDPSVHLGIWIAVVLYAAYQATEFLAAVFQARLEQGPRAIGEALGGVAMLAAVALVVWWGGGMLWMIVATAAGALVTFFWCWWRAERFYRFGLAADFAEWRTLIIMGLPVAGSQIFNMARVRGDTFILSLFHSASDVGIYGLPSKIYEILTTLSFIFGGLMMGFFVRALKDADEILFGRRLRDAMETMMVFGLGVIIFLQFHAAEILNLIGGSDYAAGAVALKFISIGIAAESLTHMLRYALLAREKQALLLRVDIFAFVTGIALYIGLIMPFSYAGAGLATAINEIILLTALVVIARSEGHKPFKLSRMMRIALSAVVLALSLWCCTSVGFNWILSAPIAAISYLAALIMTGTFSKKLLQDLRG
jgi:O-antigen/teichoic acid export membrane protein